MTTLLSNVRLKRCYLSSIKALNNIIEREYCKPPIKLCCSFLRYSKYSRYVQFNNQQSLWHTRTWKRMDHIGIAKLTIKIEAAAGEFLIEVKEMVEFLQSTFSVRVQPIYIIKELEEKDLLEKRKLSRLNVFKTVYGSSLFQMIVFVPNQQTMKATNRLCLCDIYKQDYGSCSLFKLYCKYLS